MDYQPVKQDKFRRKRKTKILLLIILIVIIIAVAVGIFLAIKFSKDKNVCGTDACEQSAKLILDNMDSTADPCDDFYQFACGNFIKKTIIPTSRSMVDAFSTTSNKIDKQMNSILSEPIKENDFGPIKLVKKVYKACMNETDIELESKNTIKNILKKLGGWPVIEGERWIENNFNWVDTLIRLRDMGIPNGIFMTFDVEIDDKNSSRRVLSVDQPFVPFEDEKKGDRDNDILHATHKLMVNIAVEFGADKNRANREMEEILNFEMNLARILIPQEQRRDMEAEYHPMSIRDLQLHYNFLPWHYFVSRIAKPATIGQDTRIIISVPKYIEKLQQLVSRTPKRVLANYILYKGAGSILNYSTKKIRDILLEFTQTAVGIASSLPRNELCTSVALRLDIASGALYVRNYFNRNSKSNTEKIVKEIEKQYQKTLMDVDWMDDSTKQTALKKLEVMNKFIGYPDELLDDSKVQEYYQDLEINSNNYVEVVLNVSKFQTEKNMQQLSEPVNKTDWRPLASVAVVNAYYDLNANAIIVPAGILQGVFFDAKRPQYLNYGSIGYIIGHEFTHGFDDEGSQMDQDGILRQWWMNDTKLAYQEKAKCIVDQYSSFIVPEVNMRINGINTQGENIADNGGVKLAYRAYQDWMINKTQEQRLPGLDYNSNQMFWIASANVWCSKMKPQNMVQDVKTEVHPPDRFRVNVPFANSNLFAKDFNCNLGSRMNPVQTCTVW